MLTFENVSFSYRPDHTVLNQVTFDLPAGSCTLLAGRNGSGKSTVVQLSNGLLRPTFGEIRLRSKATSAMAMHEIVRDVAVMLQHPGDQITERTVGREIKVGLDALGLDRTEARITAALQLVDLTHRASDHPYDLEPSQRKLVTLAATVAMQTSVVMLDEPLVGLGPAEIRIVERVVQRMRQEGRVVLFVAHDILQTWHLADRVIVLHQGRVTLDRTMTGGLTPSAVFDAGGLPPPASVRAAASLATLTS
ncbi:MAG: energy-coupling factor ABC transporter ATP-binding protein [Bacteroidetes bacterium]|jgi:energy-coupling factor transport system ATP-binding protein|nr:energy-coupling factor ABC transporter ATP-binding protein [Bacteroidota bacterium]